MPPIRIVLFIATFWANAPATITLRYAPSVPIALAGITGDVQLGYKHSLGAQYSLSESFSVGAEFDQGLYLTMATDVGDVHFTNSGLKLYALQTDTLFWKLRYVTSGGVGYMKSDGYKSAWGSMDGSSHYPYEDISEISGYGNLQAGLAINIFQSRFAIEAIPINISIGNHGFFEITPTLAVLVRVW